MASGTNYDPPPLPPPDYTKQTAEEFAKKRGPPIRGIIGDEADLPSAAEARKAFSKEEIERRRKEHEDAGLSPKTPRRPYIPGPISRQPLVRPDRDETKGADDAASNPEFNPRRSSGASQIFNTAAAPTTGEIVNTMPGGTYHTPGGKMEAETSTLQYKASDLLRVHQYPCGREALLQGMAAGTLVGAGRWILGRAPWNSMSWAVGTFALVSTAGWTYCQNQRQKERLGMKAAVRIMEEKDAEKRRRVEERSEAVARKRAKEDARREEEERRNRGRLGSMFRWWESSEKEGGEKRLRSAFSWWDGSNREEGRRREG